MKKLLNAVLVLALVLCAAPAFAEMGCKINGDGTQCGQFSNIDFRSQTGSDISKQTGLTRKIPVLDGSLFATGVGASGAISSPSTTTAVPIGYAYVRQVITSNSDPAFTAATMADGKPGQILTIRVVGLSPSGATTGGNYTITPTTTTGFTSIKLTAVGDFATFQFIDTTVGWVLLQSGGTVTIVLKP